MFGLDFDANDVTPTGMTFTAPMPGHERVDHPVTGDGYGILVTCPSAPSDPQPPYTGRCPVCGCSLSGRTYREGVAS